MGTITEVYNHRADFVKDSHKLQRLETALNNFIEKLRSKGVPIYVTAFPRTGDPCEADVLVYVPTDFGHPTK